MKIAETKRNLPEEQDTRGMMFHLIRRLLGTRWRIPIVNEFKDAPKSRLRVKEE
ncbi:MAG: hypothetical protein KIH08_11275 [Candidatus Freyarchaeota archaeon]|nr:hypothetical protein [Candidatus Jordarchaeia archaeon]MBS7268775.1 hypothetical protein [Candidatus Jordarchaeia archaeon]MBS7278241.1 hypothetical protein [Candidatus Jordarchaeia archaeon]